MLPSSHGPLMTVGTMLQGAGVRDMRAHAPVNAQRNTRAGTRTMAGGAYQLLTCRPSMPPLAQPKP